MIYRLSPVRVSPFRDLRITGYMLLPAAYRSLSRLSSTSGTKASTIHPCSLTIFFNPTVTSLDMVLNARLITINFQLIVSMLNCVSVSISFEIQTLGFSKV